MPEVLITRDQLFASVHTLQEGDVLVVRLPSHVDPKFFGQFTDKLHEKLGPLGVKCLVTTDEVTVDVIRKEQG